MMKSARAEDPVVVKTTTAANMCVNLLLRVFIFLFAFYSLEKDFLLLLKTPVLGRTDATNVANPGRNELFCSSVPWVYVAVETAFIAPQG
jgi:hypothetical protein